MEPHVVRLEEIRRSDVARFGGKNASLGELIGVLSAEGIRAPPGFATTADAYRRFVEHNGLWPLIRDTLAELAAGRTVLADAGRTIRAEVVRGRWPEDTADALKAAYRRLCDEAGQRDADVAVRSSATAEDLPEASFAGQLESFLNVRGEAALLEASRRCYASLFTDRAISYRLAKGLDERALAVSVGVQRMVRSDLAGAGVMFSIDTETGFDKVVLVNSAWGLGEGVVKGAVDPDEHQVFKPLLADPDLRPIVEKRRGEKALKVVYAEAGSTRTVPTSPAEQGAFVLDDDEVLTLARWATRIEAHYGRPMDMEWAKDGETGRLFVVQARPETVQARRAAGVFRTYRILSKGPTLATGVAVGDAVVSGRARLVRDPGRPDRFPLGAVLVAPTTDPDWVPVMKRAGAVVTDHGGRTSHAAIVSRELGIPAVIGTGDATRVLHDEQDVTISCAEGDQGFVYDGVARYEARDLDARTLPATSTRIMLNLADPAAAYRWWRLPADGIGLARMEFVVGNHIRVHPMALVRFDMLKDPAAREAVAELTQGYADKTQYFVDRLALGLARIAAVFHPKPVVVRTSDFKTNEYARLLGGAEFEPQEENPMLGLRGASRYYSPRYREGFALECRAIRRLRQTAGFRNVIVMIPFCRSPAEADRVLEVMAENGLRRGEDGLQVYVMCEIPSNVILAGAFAERFDGFSIGSNDLTQLTLGVDRDSEELAGLFDEQDEAVRRLVAEVISTAHEAGATVGLCGQAPSDHPEFAEFLVACGIDSISVSPDSFVAVKQHVAAAEAAQDARSAKRS